MSLEERMQLYMDKTDIRELRANYCYAWDAKDADSYIDFFLDDAVLDMRELGANRYEGTEEIRQFFEAINGGTDRFFVHMVHNPVIKVTGDEATGKWYFEVPNTQPDGSAAWVQGIYDEQYRRVDDEWKFKEVVTVCNYNAGYDEGWGDDV